MDMMKFPVEFDSTGVRKLREGTYDYFAQLLSISLLTEPQTMVFNPRFGVFDPTFGGIDRGAFVTVASKYVPEVQIKTLDTEFDERLGTTRVTFSFDILEA